MGHPHAEGGRSPPPPTRHYSLALPSSPAKNSAVVFKTVGFRELLSPSFLMPASLSHRTLNAINPQILVGGFSRGLNVGLKNSCSTLSLRSFRATKYCRMSKF